MSDTVDERKSVFDIYCESETGERFIVEMQKAKMHFFKDRSLFYSTFPIREQGKKGGWDYYLLPVYFILFADQFAALIICQCNCCGRCINTTN